MKNRIEILAPVGGKEQLTAAVRCGADAVYFGAPNFNARRNAENFGYEEMREAVSYCHSRDVRVHITLNTLVTDKELPLVCDEIYKIASLGADAIIVQDLGVAGLIREICPDMEMHASTQMAVHDLAGAKELERLGFSRVVLARELCADEISKIIKGTSLEVEIFVHGALCMSVSGQCYLSSMIGGRSGNRGMCAQPCRLNFHSGSREYALSLKDLSLVGRIEELINMGVYSLKIEGRMKRPEYVAAAVTACKKAASGETPDLEQLRAVFSRSGFTEGYYIGKRDLSMFGIRTKEDVASSAGVIDSIAASYRNETPLIPVDMDFLLSAGSPSRLSVNDGKNNISVSGAEPQKALTRPTSEADVKKSMQKCGGTPFYLRNLKCHIDDGVILPVSAMNSLRKSALEELEAVRSKVCAQHINKISEAFPRAAVPEVFKAPSFSCSSNTHQKPVKERSGILPEIRLRFEKLSQLSPFMTDFADKIILPLKELVRDTSLIESLGSKLICELPDAFYGNDDNTVLDRLRFLKAKGLTDAITGNLGGIVLCREARLNIFGCFDLGVLNSESLARYEQLGVCDFTLSFENNLKSARALRRKSPIGLVAYGYLPLMTFRNCPGMSKNGCERCSGAPVITDRVGSFTLLCRGGGRSRLLNCVPLYFGDKLDELNFCDHLTLYFTTEPSNVCENIVHRFISGEPYDSPMTRGLYFRELK